jgi:hypothetical protein
MVVIGLFKIEKSAASSILDVRYWTFDVGRSMFDVQSFRRTDQLKFHTSAASGRERPVKSKRKLLLMHSAIIDCGSGFQPRFTRSDKHFLTFHMRVQGSGLRVQGSGSKVQGSGFKVQPRRLPQNGQSYLRRNLMDIKISIDKLKCRCYAMQAH